MSSILTSVSYYDEIENFLGFKDKMKFFSGKKCFCVWKNRNDKKIQIRKFKNSYLKIRNLGKLLNTLEYLFFQKKLL